MPPKILIMEDDEALREWISYELALDYEVTTAADGLSGLNLVKNGNQPDLLILDVSMPGLTGLEVAKQVKDNPHTAGIPIIFLTARTTLTDKLAGFANGGLEYLTKPIKGQELLARVKAILHHTELNRQRGQAEVETEMHQAAHIQRRLMPSETPQLSGLDLHAYFQPASRIGGDFYDFIIRSDQQLVFTAADVTGKGLPAALVMASTLTALWGAAHYSASPQAALERVNTDLYDKLTGVRKLVTTFVGFYNPQTRQVT
jgi:serine phosphatase RsbU (regulator of sigma subunit)